MLIPPPHYSIIKHRRVICFLLFTKGIEKTITIGNAFFSFSLLGTKVTGSASDTTLLHTAARNGDETTINNILKKNPKAAQAVDKNGNLQLHLAAKRNDDDTDAVKMLLKAYEKGAEIKNKAGKTPHDVAANETIKHLLLEALL